MANDVSPAANDIGLEEAQKVLNGVSIPPQPKLLTEINRELQKDDPSGKRIGDAIAKDVGLSGAVLKLVNSPFFGLRSKVSSIPNAVSLLGLKNTKTLVTGLMLKASMAGGEPMMLERFWDASEKIATISTHIASLLPRVPRDETYTFGLFRECGIPLLMQRFDDYKETLKVAGGQDGPMVVIEDERHGTNHAMVGFMVAKNWGLPEMISQAILHHHDYEIYASRSADPMVCTLVSINYLAEYLLDEALRGRVSPAWQVVGNDALDHLGISGGEFNELREDIGRVVG